MRDVLSATLELPTDDEEVTMKTSTRTKGSERLEVVRLWLQAAQTVLLAVRTMLGC